MQYLNNICGRYREPPSCVYVFTEHPPPPPPDVNKSFFVLRFSHHIDSMAQVFDLSKSGVGSTSGCGQFILCPKIFISQKDFGTRFCYYKLCFSSAQAWCAVMLRKPACVRYHSTPARYEDFPTCTLVILSTDIM